MISVPKRSACARISAIRSGPMMPSRNPGKFSTAVVSISCPPASWPSMSSGLRLARAAYNAAVSPAGPDPMMVTSRCALMRGLCVLVEQLLEMIFVREPHHGLHDLSALEDQDRRNPANAEASGGVRVLVHVQLAHRHLAVVI